MTSNPLTPGVVPVEEVSEHTRQPGTLDPVEVGGRYLVVRPVTWSAYGRSEWQMPPMAQSDLSTSYSNTSTALSGQPMDFTTASVTLRIKAFFSSGARPGHSSIRTIGMFAPFCRSGLLESPGAAIHSTRPSAHLPPGSMVAVPAGIAMPSQVGLRASSKKDSVVVRRERDDGIWGRAIRPPGM